VQKGVLWWAAHHRHHHRFSDPEEDVHSPTLFGFFWSHIGWIVSDRNNDTRTITIADFAKFPVRWLNKYHFVSATIRECRFTLFGGLPLFSGFCLSTVLLWHDTFTINSLSHLFGTVRYKTPTQARTLVSRAADARRRLAHNQSPLYGSGPAGIFLVGDRYYVLHAEAFLRCAGWCGSFGSAGTFCCIR